MRKRRVAILYTHTLFGLGIAQLLRTDEQMEVTCLRADRPATAEELKQLRPYAVVIEGREESPLFSEIARDMPAALFIGVHTEDNSMVVYRGRQVVNSCPESLLEAVRHGVRGLAEPSWCGELGSPGESDQQQT